MSRDTFQDIGDGRTFRKGHGRTGTNARTLMTIMNSEPRPADRPHRTNRSAATSGPPAAQVRAVEAMDKGPAHRSAAIPGLSCAAAAAPSTIPARHCPTMTGFTYLSLLDAPAPPATWRQTRMASAGAVYPDP